MKAFAIRRKVEAHLCAHEADTITGRKWSAVTKPWRIARTILLPIQTITTGWASATNSRNHDRLMEAIFALEKILD